MFCTSEAKKKQGKYCCAYNCKNKPIEKKGGLCHKHFARKRREEDPVYTRFHQFKNNAKRRGKQFDITLEQFRQFCKDTGYIVEKGKRGANCTIDRIDNNKGYTLDNIQFLTRKQNSSKGTSDCPF